MEVTPPCALLGVKYDRKVAAAMITEIIVKVGKG
jgi:hypothetical protein